MVNDADCTRAGEVPTSLSFFIHEEITEQPKIFITFVQMSQLQPFLRELGGLMANIITTKNPAIEDAGLDKRIYQALQELVSSMDDIESSSFVEALPTRVKIEGLGVPLVDALREALASDEVDDIFKHYANMVDVGVGTKLYTGSSRLFAIKCYLDRNRSYWERWFSEAHPVEDINVVPDELWPKIELIVNQLDQQHQSISDFNYSPWNQQVTFVALVKLLVDNGLTTISISTLLEALLNFDQRTRSWSELLDFARKVENARDGKALETHFYSVMRLPIQFFGTYAKAKAYSQRVYEYTVTTPISLPDINKSDMARELLKKVYDSPTPFPREELDYYIGAEVKDVKAIILRTLFDKVMYRRGVFLETIGEYLGKIGDLEELKRMDEHYAQDELASNWGKYFKVELLSPRGLWVTSTINVLMADDGRRIDTYGSDTLLIKVLTDRCSDERCPYDGWSCSNPSELLILYPQNYGVMKIVGEDILREGSCKHYALSYDKIISEDDD